MRNKKPTAKQQAQRDANLRKISEAQGTCIVPDENLVLHALIRELEKRIDGGRELVKGLRKRIRNQAKQLARSKETNKSLRSENLKLRRSSKMRTVRAKQRKGKVQAQKEAPKVVLLKEKGVISTDMRSVVRQLVAANVPEVNVGKVLSIAAEGLGVEIVGSISARSAGRMVKEGGVAAQIQLVDEIQQNGSVGLTLSSDGTAIRNRNFESRHITLPVPSYTPASGPRGTVDPQPKKMATRVLGLSTAVDHKSDTQLSGLKKVIGACYTIYNGSPLGKLCPASIRDFACWLMGMGSDHAEDQKKLARLLEKWKEAELKYRKGLEHLRALPTQELIPIILQAVQEKVKSVGGDEVWGNLSAAERQAYDDQAMEEVCEKFGEERWGLLTPEERETAAIFIWAGCCMHKELNSVKGGAQELIRYWREEGNGPGPRQLMNKDKEAGAEALAEMAMAIGEGSAEKPVPKKAAAASPSECAAVKLTSLAGALFKHKDPKKGHQDTYKTYLEDQLGYTIPFPDTSNTRFQSYCNAAAVLIVHYDRIVAFLEFARLKKNEQAFNHMELNVYRGLQDTPTLTELCVLALYCEVLSKPYMKMVRPGGDRRVNALDLEEFHSRVKEFCMKVIGNPAMVLTFDEGAYRAGTLDGMSWDSPQVIFAIARLAPSLPHLTGCTRAFFTGALTVWQRLTSEFGETGHIHKLATEERANIFINSTNDHNEGILGQTRLLSRNAPTMGVSKMNAKLMYGHNDTEAYIKDKLADPESQKYLMHVQRELEASGAEKRERLEEIHDKQEAVAAKKRKIDNNERDKREKARLLNEQLDALTPVLDLDALQANGLWKIGGKRLTVPEIQLQLAWHRRLDVSKQLLDKKLLGSGTRRPDLLANLITAVKLYKKRERPGEARNIPSHSHTPAIPISHNPAQDEPIATWDEEEDMEDWL